MRSRASSLAVTLTILSVLVPASAFAAGPYLVDLEAVGMGQAGAFIASPSTLAAFWYNPAALAGQGGLRIELEGGLHLTPVTYQRAQDPTTGKNYPSVTNQSPLKPAIFAALSYDFGIPGLAIGAAFYSPAAGNYQYPPTGPERYMATGADNTVFNIHVGVAYQIFKWLSLGLTFGNTYFQTTQTVTVSGAPAGDPEDPSFAVPFTIAVTDPFTITSNFGVRFTPLEQLAIGVSIMPPYDINATGTANIQLPPSLSTATVTGNKVTLNVNFPMILRAGVRYKPIDRVAIEAAFVWEQWSRNKTILLAPDNISVSFPPLIDNAPLPTFALDKQNVDAFSGRLGTEIRPLDFLTARLGVFYESPAIRPSRMDLTGPDGHKVGISAGVSIQLWKFWIDAGYVHAFFPNVKVSDSQTQTISVLPGSPVATLGNGTYNMSYDMFHLGLRVALFDTPKPAPVPDVEPAASEPLPQTAASEPAPDVDATAPSTMPSP
jgi:long-subunit fatty acid transport protein